MSASVRDLEAEAQERARRAEELERKIQEQLKQIHTPLLAATGASTNVAGISKSATTNHSENTVTPSGSRMRLDEKGNLVDAEGNVVRLVNKPVATTLANAKRQKDEKRQKSKIKLERPPDLRNSEFFDPSLPVPKVGRKRRELRFFEEGEVSREVKKQRTLEIHQQRIQEQIQQQKESGVAASGSIIEHPVGAATSIVSTSVPPPKKEYGNSHVLLGGIDEVPNVEWWDEIILPNKSYNDVVSSSQVNFKEDVVARAYVEHPVPIPPATQEVDVGAIPLPLTEKERKKLRRQTRMQKELQKQKEVQLGLRPPDPPKATLKNFMQVYMNDGTQDPTKLEKMVREQMAARQKKHEDDNNARKLTKEQKKEKKIKKLEKDAEKELLVTVFRVVNASHPQNRHRITVNANQMRMTGCCILCKDINVIVAEGGAKAMRKYTHILTNRVNWNQSVDENGVDRTADDDNANKSDQDSDAEDGAPSSKNPKCSVVWRGPIQKRSFRNFKVQSFPDEITARKFLHAHGVGQYWDQAVFNIQDEAQLDAIQEEQQQAVSSTAAAAETKDMEE